MRTSSVQATPVPDASPVLQGSPPLDAARSETSDSPTRSLPRPSLSLAIPGLRPGGTGEPLARVSTAFPALDALLGGGWPRGRLSELYGGRSTGCTSLALHTAAAATRRGELVAWVDLADALHPLSLARAGALLTRVLWVRPPVWAVGLRCSELLLQSKGFSLLVLDLGDPLPRLPLAATWVRLQRAAEQAQAALLVLAPRPTAGSFATVRVRLERRWVRWLRGAWPVVAGWESLGSLERNKLGREGLQLSLSLRGDPLRVHAYS